VSTAAANELCALCEKNIEPAQEDILALLQHEYAWVRRNALRVLAESKHVPPVEPLVAALHDRNEQVREAAAKALSSYKENIPLDELFAVTLDNSIMVRKKAIEALASLGEQAPLAELMAMLDEPASEVRHAAIEALAQPGLCERVPAQILVDALNDSYYDYDLPKGTILHVLRAKDPQLAIEHSLAALGAENSEFALTAFQLLEQLQPELIPEIVQEAATLFESGTPGHFFRSLSLSFIADLIGDVDQATPDLVARLGELLDWPYWEVRAKAAKALGRLRRNIPDEIVRRLFVLRHDSCSRAVREEADKALEEILSQESGIEDD
jgi:HEAT repeat protein